MHMYVYMYYVSLFGSTQKFTKLQMIYQILNNDNST